MNHALLRTFPGRAIAAGLAVKAVGFVLGLIPIQLPGFVEDRAARRVQLRGGPATGSAG